MNAGDAGYWAGLGFWAPSAADVAHPGVFGSIRAPVAPPSRQGLLAAVTRAVPGSPVPACACAEAPLPCTAL